MKHRDYKEMMDNPSSILPEDIADYAIYGQNRTMDSDFHNQITDLIVAAENAEFAKKLVKMVFQNPNTN